MSTYEANLSSGTLALGREARRFGVWLSEAVSGLLTRFLAWRERARSRRQLAGLNPRLLRDIGIDRATAQIEADKSFWQA